jgi:hypothetical protein
MIRRGLRQNCETFRDTCATYDTPHAYPSSMPCRPQSGRKCGHSQRLAQSTAGRRSQQWARFCLRCRHRPAGQTSWPLQQYPERHSYASELRNVPQALVPHMTQRTLTPAVCIADRRWWRTGPRITSILSVTAVRIVNASVNIRGNAGRAHCRHRA